jgi:hypothetical protein
VETGRRATLNAYDRGMSRYSEAKAMERELDDFRAGAAERGGAMILLRHDDGESIGLEPLFIGAQRQQDGLMALKILGGDELRMELLGYEDDLRRMIAEPVDWSQPPP